MIFFCEKIFGVLGVTRDLSGMLNRPIRIIFLMLNLLASLSVLMHKNYNSIISNACTRVCLFFLVAYIQMSEAHCS